MARSDTITAVLTGDLVHSTSLGRAQIDAAFAALEACATAQEAWHSAPLLFARHRGDGWQVRLARPERALRSALAFRATLRALGTDAYLAVAEGPAPAELTESLNAQTGEPFTTSGRDLDAMKQAKTDIRMTHANGGAHAAAFALADFISRDWTEAQAEAMRVMLDPDRPSFTDVAATLDKSRQAVSKALYSAGIEPVTVALMALEEAP